MGNKHGKKRGDVKDLIPFENDRSNISKAQIGNNDSKAPSIFSIQQAHVINSDNGGHRGKVYCLGWAKNDNTIMATGSQDGKILFFDAMTGSRIQNVALETGWIKSIDLSAQGEFALIGSPDGAMVVRTGLLWGSEGKLSVDTKRSRASTYPGHENGVNDVKYAGNNNFVTGSGDYRCAYWDVDNTSQFIHAYDGHEGDVNSIAIHDNMFVSGSSDCSAKLWDVRNTECIRTYEGHDSDVNTVAISADGIFLATGSGDSSCKIYDLRSPGDPLLTIIEDSFARGVETVAFSPHGFHLIVGHENESVRIWNLSNNTHTKLQSPHSKKIGQVAFSPDGRFLGVASHDNTSSIYTTPR